MDLRQTLTRHRVEWRDHGANCSSGFINIQCPFCGVSDPSYHLRINELDYWWYCLRNVRHKGKSLGYLFYRLGISKDYVLQPTTQPQTYFEPKEESTPTFDITQYDEAIANSEALDYLYSRKFMFPLETAEKFKLRTSPSGKWAGRLLIPLTIGWTGRAMRTHINPRYLATDKAGFFSFGRGLSGILVEGPIDAMKVAGVTDKFVVMAMTGGVASPALLNFLRAQNLTHLFIVPDNNSTPIQRVTLMQEMRMAIPTTNMINTRLPEGHKDCGAMTENEVRRWIYSLSV